MKRVVVNPGRIDVIDVETPIPTEGEVKVEMTVTGICGSDTHAAAGRHPFVPLPYCPGHEVVGVVRELGPGVTEVAVGDRVTVEPTLPCWSCKMCDTGRSNLCENLRFFGCGYEQGGMAEFFTVPANRLHVIPDELDDMQAILIEPLSTPVHAVRLAGEVRGKAVAIIGAGTIGLLVLAAARHAGAATIVMTDMLPTKRDRAVQLGADAAFDAAAPDVVQQVRGALGESADVVFDCVALQPTVDQAVALADKGGTVMIVGVAEGPVSIPLSLIQDHQIRIQGSATYMPADYAESVRILQADEVRPADMITRRFRMDDVADAFAASAGGQEVKVVVLP